MKKILRNKRKNQLYVKDQLVKCSICGYVAMQDQYDNGECKMSFRSIFLFFYVPTIPIKCTYQIFGVKIDKNFRKEKIAKYSEMYLASFYQNQLFSY